MRMGRAELVSRTVRPAESDWNIELPAGHGEHVRGVVNHLIKRHERKTKGHELHDRSKANHGRADPHPGESILADWRVNDSLRPEALKQTLAHLVSAVILRHFFAQQEHIRIAFQFFSERL